MEITGRIIKLNDPVTGNSAKGDWIKHEFVLETEDSYPKKVCVGIFNKPELAAKVDLNARVTVHINIESKEYNNRWYTEVQAWKIESA